jgi:hypothetical protein
VSVDTYSLVVFGLAVFGATLCVTAIVKDFVRERHVRRADDALEELLVDWSDYRPLEWHRDDDLVLRVAQEDVRPLPPVQGPPDPNRRYSITIALETEVEMSATEVFGVRVEELPETIDAAAVAAEMERAGRRTLQYDWNLVDIHDMGIEVEVYDAETKTWSHARPWDPFKPKEKTA